MTGDLLEAIFGDAVGPGARLSIFALPSRTTRRFESVAEAARHVRARHDDEDVYFGLGLVAGDPLGRGTANDVAGIGCLWADLDIAGFAHEGKALPPTLDDAIALVRSMPMAPSAVVDSGHGLHAYWLLSEFWRFDDERDRQRAAALARGWHGLVCASAAAKGWTAVENLGDLARVLRVPSTVNRKVVGAPTAVRLLELDPSRRYHIDDLESFIAATPTCMPQACSHACGLMLRPEASPPAEKLAAALTESPRFAAAFRGTLDDIADVSRSGQDLSLATIAALRGWSDQEIADAIVSARRASGDNPAKALRGDYIARTLALARAAAMERAADDVDLSGFVGTTPREPDLAARLCTSPPWRSVRQLMSDHPELRPSVIHGLLRAGETMNIIAPSKTGKSWLVNNLAICVAAGRDWLDRYATEQGRVLIIDNELHGETSANRIPKVAKTMGIPLGDFADTLDVWNLRGGLTDLFTLTPVLEAIEAGRYRVIVLDAWYRFMPEGKDENDNGTMANLYNRLDKVAATLGCSFVLIHHSTKGNQSGKSVTDVGAGAGAQSRATDTHLVLREHEESGCVVLDAAVRSWPPIEPVILRWNFPLWSIDDSLDPTNLKRATPRRDRTAKRIEQPAMPKPDPWTPERFVTRFISERPRLRDEILLDAASEPSLSQATAKGLLRIAEERKRIFRWSDGPHAPTRFATVEQPLIDVGVRP